MTGPSSPRRGLFGRSWTGRSFVSEMHDMAVVPLTESTAVPVWAARLGPERLRVAVELLRFGIVGVAGFVVDAAVLTAAIALGLGPWLGRVLSYLAAATATFALNRAWTFRGAASAQPMR